MEKLCEHQNYLANMGVNTTQLYRDDFKCPWCTPRPEPEKEKTLAEVLRDASLEYMQSITEKGQGVAFMGGPESKILATVAIEWFEKKAEETASRCESSHDQCLHGFMDELRKVIR